MQLELEQIQDLASDKAFAKIGMLHIELNQLRSDIRTKTTGGITMDELNNLYLGTNKELKIWKYIAEAIEKSI